MVLGFDTAEHVQKKEEKKGRVGEYSVNAKQT